MQERKTGPCVEACLTALGVPRSSYRWTWNGRDNVWTGILRRHGFAVRSRKSAVRAPKGKRVTVGTLRAAIQAGRLDNVPDGAMFIARVKSHVLLLDRQGRTVVDTDPRVRDRRTLLSVVAVWRQ